MRDLKFRAFVKSDGKIYPVYYLSFTEEEDENVATSDCGRDGCSTCTEYYDLDEVELMQYTGLKDKNAREIYEDDVVQRILMAPSSRLINEDFIGRVIFLEGAWWIDNGQDAIPLWSESDELMVLGNIYENPELLEVTK